MPPKKTRSIAKPVRSKDVPATSAMLYQMEERLNKRMDKGFAHVDSQIHGLKSEIFGVKSELHRVALLVEEQNARNKYVMDGYAQLYDLIAERIAK